MACDSADAASDTQGTENDPANANRESHQLTLIDDALRPLREYPGAYTTCERCDAPIEDERLDLVPWTRLSASCARETNAGASQDWHPPRGRRPLRPSGRVNNQAGHLSRYGDRAR